MGLYGGRYPVPRWALPRATVGVTPCHGGRYPVPRWALDFAFSEMLDLGFTGDIDDFH